MTGPRAYPVAETGAYLAGRWRLTRLGWDGLLGQMLRLAGEARFEPEAGGLAYAETGTLRFGTFRGEASRRYRCEPRADGSLAVLFEDGRPFHTLDLGDGRDAFTHLCAPDLYRGRAHVLGPGRWLLAWRIEGRRKRLAIVNRYDRLDT